MPLNKIEKENWVKKIKTPKLGAKVTQVLLKAIEMEGSLNWAAAGGIDAWTRGGETVYKTKAMVCWLAPLYIAYQAGVAKQSMLDRYNQCALATFPLGGTGPDKVPYAEASHMGAEAFYRVSTSKGASKPGDVVLFYRSNYDHVIHYAMCMEGLKVASLWSQPNNNNTLQICTVADLSGVIQRENPGTTVSVRGVTPPWL
ncbi:MAG: hypothetical protein KC553_03800 [Nitrospina sp.]|nr:hypothetical protein [Nitrospina sp.]